MMVQLTYLLVSRYSQRLIPVSAVGPATMNGLEALAAKIVPGRFADLATAATSVCAVHGCNRVDDRSPGCSTRLR
jgi:hypothetical protein